MFIEIVEQLLPALSDGDLHDLISGASTPSDDAPENRARDREFELYFAAVCCRSGLTVELSEPDALVKVSDRTVAIAAKRLRSQKKTRKNLQKAAMQIGATGYPGLVVVDVTQVVDPGAEIITHWRQEGRALRSAIGRFGDRHSALLHANRGEKVLGVLLRAAVPLVSSGFRYGTYEAWEVRPASGQVASDVHEVAARMLRGFEGS